MSAVRFCPWPHFPFLKFNQLHPLRFRLSSILSPAFLELFYFSSKTTLRNALSSASCSPSSLRAGLAPAVGRTDYVEQQYRSAERHLGRAAEEVLRLALSELANTEPRSGRGRALKLQPKIAYQDGKLRGTPKGQHRDCREVTEAAVLPPGYTRVARQIADRRLKLAGYRQDRSRV